MTIAQNSFRPGLPATSTAFVHFALDVVQLLQQANPSGLDQDRFLNAYFQGNPPANQSDRDAWWEEFKRARLFESSLRQGNLSMGYDSRTARCTSRPVFLPHSRATR